MPTPPEFKAPFYPDGYYHIVCKSIDGLVLFKEKIDYQVFLQRFLQFTNHLLDVWSYSLLTNHTHHIVKMKTAAIVLKNIKTIPNQTVSMKSFLAQPDNEVLFDTVMERQMNSFLVSFANYTNNKYNRQGGLFQKPFKRIQVIDDAHLQQAVIYVHPNAQKHNLTKDFITHPFSSYLSIINNNSAFTDNKSVLEFFGGMENFISTHRKQVDFYYGSNWPSSKLE